jgi:hypothetical protein
LVSVWLRSGAVRLPDGGFANIDSAPPGSRPRNRRQMVPAEVTHFAPALFAASFRRAELPLRSLVRTKCDQACRCLPPMPAQNLLHRALQIVVAQAPEYP